MSAASSPSRPTRTGVLLVDGVAGNYGPIHHLLLEIFDGGSLYSEMVYRNEGLWFHPAARRGAGRIRAQISGPEAGYTSLVEGAKVSYELITGRNGESSAENLRFG